MGQNQKCFHQRDHQNEQHHNGHHFQDLPDVSFQEGQRAENAGGGGRWAAPIASLMIEKYTRGEIKEKTFEYDRVTKANFINP